MNDAPTRPDRKTLPDPRGGPGPTLDERAQVFAANHLVGSFVALGVFAFSVLWVLTHWK